MIAIITLSLAFLATLFAGISAYCDLQNSRREGTVNFQGKSTLRCRYVEMGMFLVLIWGAVIFDFYNCRHLPDPYLIAEPSKEGLWPRSFTKDQQTKLFELLNKVPDGVEHVITIEAVENCRDCSLLAENLRFEWGKVPGWRVNHASSIPVDSHLVGLRVAFRSDCTGEGIRLIMEALKSLELMSSDVSPYTDEEKKFPFRTSCSIFVGNRS